MLSKEYLDTARTILRAAQTMTDQHIAGQVKCAAPALGAGSRSTASRDDGLRCWCPMLN